MSPILRFLAVVPSLSRPAWLRCMPAFRGDRSPRPLIPLFLLPVFVPSSSRPPSSSDAHDPLSIGLDGIGCVRLLWPSFSSVNERTNEKTDQPTNGATNDEQTDGRTDGGTNGRSEQAANYERANERNKEQLGAKFSKRIAYNFTTIRPLPPSSLCGAFSLALIFAQLFPRRSAGSILSASTDIAQALSSQFAV